MSLHSCTRWLSGLLKYTFDVYNLTNRPNFDDPADEVCITRSRR
jgi:hypothetical protein